MCVGGEGEFFVVAAVVLTATVAVVVVLVVGVGVLQGQASPCEHGLVGLFV